MADPQKVYLEYSLDEVASYFIKDFRAPTGRRIMPYGKKEVFFDPVQKKFIFTVITEKDEENGQSK